MSVGLGNRFPGQTQPIDVERDGGVHLVLDLVTRAAGQGRRERGKDGFSGFDGDEVAVDLSPAGLSMKFCVPGGFEYAPGIDQPSFTSFLDASQRH